MYESEHFAVAPAAAAVESFVDDTSKSADINKTYSAQLNVQPICDAARITSLHLTLKQRQTKIPVKKTHAV